MPTLDLNVGYPMREISTSHWSRGPAYTQEPELGEKDPSGSLQGSSLHCLYHKLSPCFEIADSVSSKVEQTEVNVVGGALKTYKVAFRGAEPQSSCCLSSMFS